MSGFMTAQVLLNTVERSSAVLLMPVAGGLIAALAIVAFFMRFAAKKGELDKERDKFNPRYKKF